MKKTYEKPIAESLIFSAKDEMLAGIEGNGSILWGSENIGDGNPEWED